MPASFFKRLFSAVFDTVLIIFILYLIFIIGFRSLIQNSVDNFDLIYASYQEVVDIYQEDLLKIQTEYQTNLELAGEDKELQLEALALYNMRMDIINAQSSIDSEPYNKPLTDYMFSNVYYYSFGFIVLMSITTIFLKSKTPGRWIMKIELTSSLGENGVKTPSLLQILSHDIFLKYFLLALLIVIGLMYGIVYLFILLTIDIFMISLTKKKITMRDYITKTKVVKANFGY